MPAFHDLRMFVVKSKSESESEVAQSCPTLCDPMDYSLPGFSIHGIFPGKNTGVGCYFLLQGIFLAQGSNLGLPHCRQMLYRLSHQGSEGHVNKKLDAVRYQAIPTNSIHDIPSREDHFYHHHHLTIPTEESTGRQSRCYTKDLNKDLK